MEPRLELASQRPVDEAVPRDGILPGERFGDGVDPEVSLRVRGSSGVSRMASVEVRLVGYCERDGGEGGLEFAVF